MQGEEKLIPHPSVVRERLSAEHPRRPVLRTLLRLSVRTSKLNRCRLAYRAAGPAQDAAHGGLVLDERTR